MAEKTTKKAATTKTATEQKATKSCATKTCAKKAPAKKSNVIYVNAENAGFRAGDVYQILAASEKPLAVAEIAKAANVALEDAYLGLGWLLKEGKISSTEDNKIALA